MYIGEKARLEAEKKAAAAVEYLFKDPNIPENVKRAEIEKAVAAANYPGVTVQGVSSLAGQQAQPTQSYSRPAPQSNVTYSAEKGGYVIDPNVGKQYQTTINNVQVQGTKSFIERQIAAEQQKRQAEYENRISQTLAKQRAVDPTIYASEKFAALAKAREPDIRRVFEREAQQKALRQDLEPSPVDVIIRSAIERGQVTTLKELRQLYPQPTTYGEQTRQQETQQMLIDKYRNIWNAKPSIQKAKEYFPAYFTRPQEMEAARRQLKEEAIASGDTKREYLLTGAAPGLSPIARNIALGAATMGGIGILSKAPVIGSAISSLATSKKVGYTLGGLYALSKGAEFAEKAKAEPTYYKRPSGVIEFLGQTTAEVGGFLTGGAIAGAAISKLPKVSISTRNRPVTTDKVGYGQEKILKRTTINLFRGEAGEGFKVSSWVSPQGRFRVNYIKTWDITRPAPKTVDTSVQKTAEVVYPAPAVLKNYPIARKGTVRFFTGPQELGYRPVLTGSGGVNLLEVGKTSISEPYGYTRNFQQRFKQQIAEGIRRNLFFESPIIIKQTGKPSLPKAPKGYRYVERNIPDALGRVQIQMQLVKLREPKLKTVLLQEQMQKPKLKTEQIQILKSRLESKQVTAQKTAQKQKQALSLNQLLGSESILASGLASALGLRSSLESAQMQKRAQMQKSAQAQQSLLLSVQKSAQVQKQEQKSMLLSAQASILESASLNLLAVESASMPALAVESASALESKQELRTQQRYELKRLLKQEQEQQSKNILGFGSNQEEGYIAYAKRKQLKQGKGKYKNVGYERINKTPLTRSQALNRLMVILDKYTNRSGYIKKAGRAAPSNERINIALLARFRSAKRNANLLVEKSKYAISSYEEKQGIPYEALRQKEALIKRRDELLFRLKEKKRQQRINFFSTARKKQASYLSSRKQNQINMLRSFVTNQKAKKAKRIKWI